MLVMCRASAFIGSVGRDSAVTGSSAVREQGLPSQGPKTFAAGILSAPVSTQPQAQDALLGLCMASLSHPLLSLRQGLWRIMYVLGTRICEARLLPTHSQYYWSSQNASS